MCGFAGFCDYNDSLRADKYLWKALVRRMTTRISHRGPDDRDEFVSDHSAFGHARLSIIDPENGAQPMTIRHERFDYTIVYNGELYNAAELRSELEEIGYLFRTRCDTEVVLNAYIHFGEDCVNHFNGIFAFAVDDSARNQTVLARDRFGVKPLFYTFSNGRIVFASEIKALFEYPGVNPVIKREGLCEIIGLGPARTPGCGVFNGIREILPGNLAVFDRNGFFQKTYFMLDAYPHTDNYEKTVRHVRALLIDAVERQLTSDVPLCAFLSGGLDSSIITAIAAHRLKEQGKTLSTYAFDFTGNDAYFRPSSFQPERDCDWAERVSALLGTSHTTLECGSDALLSSLYDGVIAKDLPGMADVDGSLVYFCRQVKARHDVALCGECADELFGGYPWFHDTDMFDGSVFPWSNSLDLRQRLLKPELARALGLKDYVTQKLETSLSIVPALPGEPEAEHRMRAVSHLNIQWFMSTLLDRKDRCSMASGLEVRVPYADHRLAEYVFNVPWDFKCPQGVTKGLLRDAAKNLLPDDVLYRKKSPYPKTYHPEYEKLLRLRLTHILNDSLQPIHKILSKEAIQALANEPNDFGKPWFGQLMAGPQMLAYLIQINYWLMHYNIYIDI